MNKIMALFGAVSLSVAFGASAGTRMAYTSMPGPEARTKALCAREVTEIGQIFWGRVQGTDIESLLGPLVEPARAAKVVAVYQLDMSGWGIDTMTNINTLLQLHYDMCLLKHSKGS